MHRNTNVGMKKGRDRGRMILKGFQDLIYGFLCLQK